MASVLKGKWGSDIAWQVTPTTEMPPEELITAVFCVAISKNCKIVLARSKRGWGLLGGHIEKGETVLETLKRESLEEGGFIPKNPQLFAAMKIIPSKPILKPNSTSEYYPFPLSYQLYYWSANEATVTKPTGEEIIESRSFPLLEIKRLKIPDYPVIELGYKASQLVN